MFQTGNTFNSILPIFDIWIAFGWLALLSVFNEIRENIQSKIIVLPIMVYVLVLFFFGSQGHFYPWYYIPLYPFLSVVLGIFFYKFIKNSDFISASLILIFIGSWLIDNLFIDPRWQIFPLNDFKTFKYIFMLIVSCILFPFLFWSIFPSRKAKLIRDIVAVSILVLLIIANILVVYNYSNVLIRR